MAIHNRLSILTVLFFVTGLLFPVLQADFAQAMAAGPGCCTSEDDGGECIGCGDGESCMTTGVYCEQEGGTFRLLDVCEQADSEASCVNRRTTQGCCVIDPEDCVDDTEVFECLTPPSRGADFWVENQACSQVPQCTVTRNIPTMSNWGLIALAGIFILVGVWAITRKKAEV